MDFSMQSLLVITMICLFSTVAVIVVWSDSSRTFEAYNGPVTCMLEREFRVMRFFKPNADYIKVICKPSRAGLDEEQLYFEVPGYFHEVSQKTQTQIIKVAARRKSVYPRKIISICRIGA